MRESDSDGGCQRNLAFDLLGGVAHAAPYCVCPFDEMRLFLGCSAVGAAKAIPIFAHMNEFALVAVQKLPDCHPDIGIKPEFEPLGGAQMQFHAAVRNGIGDIVKIGGLFAAIALLVEEHDFKHLRLFCFAVCAKSDFAVE